MSLLSAITPTSALPEAAPGTKKLLVNNTTKNNANNRQHDESGPGKGKKRLSIKPALAQELADMMLFNNSVVDTGDDANCVDDVWSIEDPPELPPAPTMGSSTDSLDAPMTDEPEEVVADANVGQVLPLPDECQEVVDWEFSLSADEILNHSLSWLCLDKDLPVLSGDDLADFFGPEVLEPEPALEDSVTLTISDPDPGSCEVIDITAQVIAALSTATEDTAARELAGGPLVVFEPSPIDIEAQDFLQELLGQDPLTDNEAPTDIIFSDGPVAGFDENFLPPITASAEDIATTDEPTGPMQHDAQLEALSIDPEMPVPVIQVALPATTKRGRGRPRIIREPVPNPPVTKRRGRPALPCNAIQLPPIPENISEEEKYRRMRDLNNEASRRCRINRKRKFEQVADTIEVQNQRQRCLLNKIESMTAQILKLRAITDSCPYCKKKLNVCFQGH